MYKLAAWKMFYLTFPRLSLFFANSSKASHLQMHVLVLRLSPYLVTSNQTGMSASMLPRSGSFPMVWLMQCYCFPHTENYNAGIYSLFSESGLSIDFIIYSRWKPALCPWCQQMQFKDSRGRGEKRSRTKVDSYHLSFHIVFQVLITGVKGHDLSESHTLLSWICCTMISCIPTPSYQHT